MIENLNQIIAKHTHKLDASGTVLLSGANTGFFSNCSHSLWSIVELANVGHVVDELNFKGAFRNFKDDNKQHNIYSDLFHTNESSVKNLKEYIRHHSRFRCPDHHGVYKIFPYDELNHFVQAYFLPAKSVRQLCDAIASRYAIDFSNTIAVCYRGTDKATEVGLADPCDYVERVRMIHHEGLRVMIQTDQEQVKQYFLAKIPDSFSIDEMPTTAGQQVLHQLHAKELGLGRIEFGQYLLAVTYLMSQCRYIVNHTGNMAAWICLLRGDAQGVDQFDRYGASVGSYQIAKAHAKNQYRKIRRIIKSENACYV